jgi:hypothetical protein
MRQMLALLALSSMGLFVSTVGFAWAWVVARGRAIRAEALLEGRNQQHFPQNPGLANAVESMALEIERIGESQRFLTKVLTDRAERSLPKSSGYTTPH